MLVLKSTAAEARGVHWQGTTAGAGHVHLVTTLAGEDAVRDLQKVSVESSYTVVGSTRQALKAGAGTLYGWTCLGNAAAGVLILYDGLSTAGQVIEPSVAGTTVGTSSERMFGFGKRYATGLYAAVSATMASSTMILVWHN